MTERKRAVRDPVHDYITLSDAETAIIDSPFIQRLRWVSQLSGVKLVFPGGVHNRFTHVMGVMHLSGQYAAHLYQIDPDKEHKIQVARLAGLLHDIGHGAFSHAYDDTVYKELYPGNPHGHDAHRNLIIQSKYLKPLIEACGVTTDEIIDLWDGKDPVLQALVQGALGADRMDFMLRDSFFTGTTHFGVVAISRIISNSRIELHEGKPALHYNAKVLDDIFQALLGRFYMYRGVYFHKASGAADIIIRKLLSAARKPLKLVERTSDLDQFQFINEYTLLGEIMASKEADIEPAQNYTIRLMHRDLPKLVWETIVSESVVKTISKDLGRACEIIAEENFMNNVYELAKKLGKNLPELYVTNTYPMSTIDDSEFTAGHVFLYDEAARLVPGKHSITLAEAIQSTSYFQTFISGIQTRQRYVMIRVYSDKLDVDWIKQNMDKLVDAASNTPSIAETSY